MTIRKNRGRKRGVGGPSKHPDGSFKTRLMARQQELLISKVSSRMDQLEAPITRSAGPASTATAGFILTAVIINILVTEMNSAPCMYCQAGTVCSHERKHLCFPQDVTAAYTFLTETAETAQANKAQKAADKIERLQNLRFRQAEATRTQMAERKAARVRSSLARAALNEANDWIDECNSFFLPSYRPSQFNENNAKLLFEATRPLLKEKLVMWANGGPQQPEETIVFDEPNGSDSEDENEDDDGEEDVFNSTSDQFNAKLVEMDSVAKKFAEKFPIEFGAAYLTSLVHYNARQDFTPAIQLTALPVTAVRFGDCGLNNQGRRPAAADISKSVNPRARSRDVMNTAAKSLQKTMNWLVDNVDEVNNRPATRKFKMPLTSTSTESPAIDQVLLEREIVDLETTLCAKYRLRASMMQQTGNMSSTTSAVNTPTQAIALVAGPKHYYDTTTMFQFTANIPENCPLPKMFRALYAVREDDVPQTREQARTKKRERHAISSIDELSQRKETTRFARV